MIGRLGSMRIGSSRSSIPDRSLGDYPQFVEPVREVARFEAPALDRRSGCRPGSPRLAVFLQRSRHHRGAEPAPIRPDGRDRGPSLGHRRRPGLAHARARRCGVSMHARQEQDRARPRRHGHRSRSSRRMRAKVGLLMATACPERRTRFARRSTVRFAKAAQRPGTASKASGSSRPSSRPLLTRGSRSPVDLDALARPR